MLVNPTAGKGRGERNAARALPVLRNAGLDMVELRGRDADEAEDLARDVVARGVDGLVVVGGDGMANLAAQVLAGTDIPFGMIPSGTGNDVARYLDLDRKDAARAAHVVVGGRTRSIDLADVDGTKVVTVVCTGFDSKVSERANHMTWPRGQMRYNLATLSELRVFQPIQYALELDGERVELDAMLVAVGNGRSYGGGLRICEGAELDDGLLDVVIIKPMSKPELVRVYPRLFKGTHVTHPAYEHHRVASVSIHASGLVGYGDGERIGALPFTVRALPGSLRVFVP